MGLGYSAVEAGCGWDHGCFAGHLSCARGGLVVTVVTVVIVWDMMNGRKLVEVEEKKKNV